MLKKNQTIKPPLLALQGKHSSEEKVFKKGVEFVLFSYTNVEKYFSLSHLWKYLFVELVIFYLILKICVDNYVLHWPV